MRLFISYSRQEFAHAAALHEELAEAGHKPWLDEVDIPTGVSWPEEIRQAIDRAEVFLLIASPWSLSSKNVRREWQQALAQKKRILVLVTQSMKRGVEQGELAGLPWVDLRNKPLNAAHRVLEWLDDPTRAHTSPLPSSPRCLPLFTDRIPSAVHLAAWVQIMSGAIGLGILFSFLARMSQVQFTTYFTHPALSSKSLAGLLYDKFIIAVYVLLALIGAAFQLGTIRNGVLTYRRECNKPAHSLGSASSYLRILSLCMIVIGFLSFLITLLLESVMSARQMQIIRYGSVIAYGVVLLVHSVVVTGLTGSCESGALKRWLPAYSPAEWRWRPLERSPQPSPWDRSAAPITLSGAVRAVCLTYAPQDAGFGRFLKRSLRRKRLHINEGQPTPGTDEALIVILTAWSATNRKIEGHWREALHAGMPIIPVLLEDAHLPLELSRLQHIDARQDLPGARDDILTLFQGKPYEARLRDKPHEARQQASPEASPRPSKANVIQPQVVTVPLYVLFISSALRLFIVTMLCPIALWIYPELSLQARAAASVLFVIACVQSVVAGAFSVRRFSFTLMPLVLIGCTLGTAALLPHLWPELNLTLGLPVSIGLLRHIIGLSDAAVIGLLLLIPTCRRWAVRGLVLRLERLPTLCVLYYPSIAALALLAFLLPVYATGGRVEDISRGSMELAYGQAVLARFESDEAIHSWRFVAAPGDAITIRLEAASLFLRPRVMLYDGNNQIIADRQEESTSMHQFVGMHLQAGGTYTISVQAAESSRGVYRLQLLQYEASSIACGQAVRVSLSRTTPWVKWSFEAHRGDAVFIEMVPIKHHSTPECALLNPRGIALAGDSDSPAYDYLRIYSFMIEENGVYDVWAGETPASNGDYGYEGYTLPYILTLDCREAGSEQVIPRGYTGPVMEMVSSPRGTLVASRRPDRSIVVWELETGTERALLAGNTSQRVDIAFSADGSLAATAEGYETRLWDLETGTEIVTMEAKSTSVAFSPDGTVLAIGGWHSTIDYGSIQLWDVKTGAKLAVLEGHKGWVESVAFSPDGTLLAAASYHIVRLWNVETGTEVALLQGHSHDVTGIAFSPGGTVIASGSKDGTVRLWDVQTGTALATLKAHDGLVQDVAFNPTGTMLAFGGSEGTIQLWDVETSSLSRIIFLVAQANFLC